MICLYGRRTGSVRVLSVVTASSSQHTGRMAIDANRASVIGADRETFDTVILPHLDVAYRLARRLMRDADTADDVVQEASLRAFRYFQTFAGGDGRAWFLRIVRNTCYGWRRPAHAALTDSFDEEQHSNVRAQSNPEILLLQTDEATSTARVLDSLPDHFQQLLVLREVEGLSYRELSDVIGIPMGTVMSRLSRAREALRGALDGDLPRSAASSTSQPSPEEEADLVLA